jgi:hypothetical protein
MSINNITTENKIIHPLKNLWCRDTYAHYIIKNSNHNPFRQGKGYNIRHCTYCNNCRGAHSLEEIKPYPYIYYWNNLDKSKYNFVNMFVNIVSVINRDKSKINSFSSFNEKISKINKMNFIEVLQLWHELSCHYRKIAKELPKKRDWKSPIPHVTKSSGYVFADDVPGFYLDDKTLEDNAWAFVRMTRFCNTYLTFNNKIKKQENVTIWEICLGEINCKEGVHNINESICIENFLTGICSCNTKEEIDSMKLTLQEEINNLEKLIFSTDIKQHGHITFNINKKKSELNNIQRKIHYTEYGMKPWNIQFEEYIVQLEEKRKKEEEEEANRIKPDWDHNIIKTEEIKIGKLTKISLKINKK